MNLPRADRTLVMGILNTTPDSFSDGGQFFNADSAIKHGLEMAELGADIIDVGGESTRPGAVRISIEEEQQRTIPVVRELVAAGLTVSIDTMNAATARAAVDAGASIINDVSGGLADSEMAATAAELECGYIAMHWRGHSDVMQKLSSYQNVVPDVIAELSARIEALLVAGINPAKLAIDPGLGFAKEADHNWELLREVDQLQALNYPVLIGASRKRFLASIAHEDRDDATAAISAMMATHGVWAVRVHDVRKSRQAIDVVEALRWV